MAYDEADAKIAEIRKALEAITYQALKHLKKVNFARKSNPPPPMTDIATAYLQHEAIQNKRRETGTAAGETPRPIAPQEFIAGQILDYTKTGKAAPNADIDEFAVNYLKAAVKGNDTPGREKLTRESLFSINRAHYDSYPNDQPQHKLSVEGMYKALGEGMRSLELAQAVIAAGSPFGLAVNLNKLLRSRVEQLVAEKPEIKALFEQLPEPEIDRFAMKGGAVEAAAISAIAKIIEGLPADQLERILGPEDAGNARK